MYVVFAYWNPQGKGGRRPWKVWDVTRLTKIIILASSLRELLERGNNRFHLPLVVDEPLDRELFGLTSEDNR